MLKTIVITEEQHGFRVTHGDRYQHGMSWDEALGCIAWALTHNMEQGKYLRTAEEHEAMELRYGLPKHQPLSETERLLTEQCTQ